MGNIARRGKILLALWPGSPRSDHAGACLGHSIRACKSPSCVGVSDTFRPFQLSVLCCYFEHQRRVQLERCVAELLQTITAILFVDMDLLALSHCAAGCLESSDEGVPACAVEGFVDNITAFIEGRNKELPGMSEKVLKSMRMEVEEKGAML